MSASLANGIFSVYSGTSHERCAMKTQQPKPTQQRDGSQSHTVGVFLSNLVEISTRETHMWKGPVVFLHKHLLTKDPVNSTMTCPSVHA